MRSWIFGRKEAPKNELATLVELFRVGDPQFLQAVNLRVSSLNPNGVSMLIVAYKNLIPMFEACKQLAERDPVKAAREKHNVGTMEGFFGSLCDSYEEMTAEHLSKTLNIDMREAAEQVERSKRRIAWFAQALLLLRADKLAMNNTQCLDMHAETWAFIARNITIFRSVLEHNILWTDEEMDWFGTKTDKFSFMKDQKSAFDYCISIIMPKYLRKTEIIRSLVGRDKYLLI